MNHSTEQYINERVEEIKKTFINLPQPIVNWFHQEMEDLTTHILENDIRELEGMKKEVKIISSGTGKKDGHVDFEAIAWNKFIDTLLTSKHQTLSQMNKDKTNGL